MKHIVLGTLAHVDAGKTTLSENLLFHTGTIRKLGRVDNGDAFLDNNEMERERGITIFSKQAILRTDELEMTLLDTPGHVDFSAEMERTLQVLDYGILLISQADGVNAHTKTLWNLLKRYNIPVFIFVNKMDQPGADKSKILKDIQNNLSKLAVDFTDVDSQMEEIATAKEEFLEMYLEGNRIPDESIAAAIKERLIFPCFFGSALKDQGIAEFIEGLEKYTVSKDYGNDFSAVCFKISRDTEGQRLTHLKITGGSLKTRTNIEGLGKVNQIRVYSGLKYETFEELESGRVCQVLGLNDTRAGQIIGSEGEEMLPVLAPVLNYKVILEKGYDSGLVFPKLKEIEEEIPELHITYEEELREIHAELMGEVQIEIIKKIISDRFGFSVEFGTGKILYRETIENESVGVGHFEPLRHYAEVQLLLEPLPRGSGLEFSVNCSEDILSKNWQRLILTHLDEKKHLGVLTRSPITDMRITIVSGRAHDKHTEGGDFRQATYRAVRNGLMYAKNVLLEPYYDYVLEVPGDNLGKAMLDMETMKCSMNPPEILGGKAILTGFGPAVLLQNYQKEVTIYTKGHGRIELNYRGYEKCHNEEAVIEELGYDPEKDIRNTPDSVFCSHGAGHVVPWYEVRDNMHTEYIFAKKKSLEEQVVIKPRESLTESLDLALGTEEIDEIINRTSNANKKSKGNQWNHKKPVSDVVYRNYTKYEKKEKYLLVDGYNVIFAWQELNEIAKANIDAARGKLLDIMCNYQGITGVNLIVVFDAYRIAGHATEFLDYHNIHVVYTREAETADRYIEHFAHENSSKFDITVATSDGLEQIIIRGEGCHLLSSRDFEKEVERVSKQLMEEYNSRED